jgi:VanZ family protein
MQNGLNQKNKNLLFWLYILSIFLLAVLPINSQDNMVLNHTYVVHIRVDHLLHGVQFLPWFLLGIYCRQIPVYKLLIIGLLLAILTEGIQYFLPYRAFNINDMISNVFGVVAGLVILKTFTLFRAL